MSKLYTAPMLALTTQLARFPLSEGFETTAEGRSSLCGSTLQLGLNRNVDGAVSKIGLRVAACAVGQASAAIMAEAIEGASAQDINTALDAIRAWLEQDGPLPEWPGFEALAGALAHPGRHGALILPWETTSRALSSARPSVVALSSDAGAR